MLILRYFCHSGMACLFVFNNKKPKSDIFGNIKGHVTPV